MPHVIVIAGANGAGKSTVAPALLRDTLGISEFVNADTLAQGLLAFSPETVAITAGEIMLRRLDELAEQLNGFVKADTTFPKRQLKGVTKKVCVIFSRFISRLPTVGIFTKTRTKKI